LLQHREGNEQVRSKRLNYVLKLNSFSFTGKSDDQGISGSLQKPNQAPQPHNPVTKYHDKPLNPYRINVENRVSS